jgi:transposase
MNPDTTKAQSTIFRVRVELYSARHIAKIIGCSLPTAYDWRSGRRSPPAWMQDQIIANLASHVKTLNPI